MLKARAHSGQGCKRPRAQDKSKASRDKRAQKTMIFLSVPNRASKTKRGRCRQLRIQRKEADPNHNSTSRAAIQCPPASFWFIKAAPKKVDVARPNTAASAAYRFGFEVLSIKSPSSSAGP